MSIKDLKKKAIGRIEAIEDNGFLENLVSALERHEREFHQNKQYLNKVLKEVEEGKEAVISHEELETSIENTIQKHETGLR